jgi:hypothetical protein
VRVFLAIACILAAAGCGDDEGPDTTPPQVQSTVPAGDETGVDPEANIYIVFSEAIDRNTLDNNMFHLEGIYGSVSYDLATFQATLALMAPLDNGVTYQAVLEPGIRDLADNRMNEAYRWSFTVAE